MAFLSMLFADNYYCCLLSNWVCLIGWRLNFCVIFLVLAFESKRSMNENRGDFTLSGAA